MENANIYYEQYGEGIPLIFLHGYHIDGKCFSIPVERFLQEGNHFCRVYPDLPGMGRTTLRERVDTTEKLFNIMLQFIDIVSDYGDFAVVGYSYGGYLARALVKHRKERLKGIFLLCPVIIPDRGGRLLPDFRIVVEDRDFLCTLDEEERTFFTGSAVVQTERVYKRMKKEIIEPFKLADHEMLKDLQKNAYAFEKPIDNLNHFFEGPVQFLAGRQDSVVGYEDILSIFEDYPNGELTILNGAGHNLQIEREKAFSRIFRNWLKRILFYCG
ncbi:MAG: alpha/beta hydrolase [Spirochaetaceae bacterium]|nr:alpha/beta hydrolase [Spirochaetaceae bacterium]